MPYMGMDIASMKKADLDVYVENEKLAYGIRIGDEQNKNIIPIMMYRRNKMNELTKKVEYCM